MANSVDPNQNLGAVSSTKFGKGNKQCLFLCLDCLREITHNVTYMYCSDKLEYLFILRNKKTHDNRGLQSNKFNVIC